jgi:ATP-dependent DNA helicase RecG
MEMAVEVMRASIPEPREDGKASPRVGAVLVKADGSVVTAFRGELRHGDHAEFTLLERKHRGEDLTGATLFATLEPCAPTARKFPKLGCAERIALARIKEVWVGIEDPDPTVDRKGLKFLELRKIKYEMFDLDLQEVIRRENKDFIEQALERAAAGDEPMEVSLSPLEAELAHTDYESFSREALERFRDRGRISERMGSASFYLKLAQMGLLKGENSNLRPTGFGLLLFGRNPREAVPQAGLLATVHYPNGREEIENFDGPQVLVPDAALRWLRDKLPNIIDRSQARRRAAEEPLFEMVREGIVNALVHRDYSEKRAKCQLVVTPDTIEIRSPGKPVKPLTLAQLQSLESPMLSRNPVLHYVFARMELAEERGLGLKSLRRRAEEAALPLPTYRWEDPYLILRIYRSREAASVSLAAEIASRLSGAEKQGWQWFSTRLRAKSSQYAQAMDVDERTARRHLNLFVELGLLRKTGSARSTVYEVTRS